MESKNETILTGSERPGDAAIVGRTTEGLIFMVVPPVVMATTFMMLAGNHISLTCEFVNGLAFHMTDELAGETKIASPKMLAAVKDNVLKRHGVENLTEGMWHKGDAETFEGSYYAEFHPMELAAVGEVMEEIRAVLPPVDAPVIRAVTNLWADAAKQFVEDNERLAATGMSGSA